MKLKKFCLRFFHKEQNSKFEILIFPTPTGRQWLNCNGARKKKKKQKKIKIIKIALHTMSTLWNDYFFSCPQCTMVNPVLYCEGFIFLLLKMLFNYRRLIQM